MSLELKYDDGCNHLTTHFNCKYVVLETFKTAFYEVKGALFEHHLANV